MRIHYTEKRNMYLYFLKFTSLYKAGISLSVLTTEVQILCYFYSKVRKNFPVNVRKGFDKVIYSVWDKAEERCNYGEERIFFTKNLISDLCHRHFYRIKETVV